MKNLCVSFLFLAVIFFSRTAFAQVIDTPILRNLNLGLINGRVINIKLQNIKGAIITNKRTNRKDTTNNLGFYKTLAAVNDTLFYEYPGLSRELRKVKKLNSKLNVILIKRTVDSLPEHSLKTDSVKAKKADEELYRILEKDAKLEGNWNY